MSWNKGKTGANTLPLGPRKRMIGDVNPEDEYQGRGRSTESPYGHHAEPAPSPYDSHAYQQHQAPNAYTSRNEPYPAKREEGSAAPGAYTSRSEASSAPREDGAEEPRRKRRSRWAAEDEKVTIPGMPTALPTNMTPEQLEMFLLHTRLEEIARKLKTGDVLPAVERERSRSPEPVYNAEGKRVNTREYRYRKKLEDERHHLIEGAIKKYPDFRPPADYKRPTKTMDKVYIPVKDFPEINFIGLLIGPRGNTLKKMETESGAKISIRGKGSVKEGKSRSDSASSANQEEDLHCLVSADTEEKVAKAIQLINKIIETSASVPEGQNELKRMQLRELASLNGTLRDDENQTCLNCGALGHRKYECPEIHNVTINLVCGICGGHGHATRDCRERNNPEAQQRNQKIDSEYLNLMAELGEQVPAGASASAAPSGASERDYGSNGGSSGPYGPPRRTSQSGSAPPPWASRDRESSSHSSAPPPWARNSSAAPPSSSPAPWQHHGAPGTTPPPPPPSSAAPWQQSSGSASSNPWNTSAPAPGHADPSAAPPPPGYPSAAYPYNPYAGYYGAYGAPPPPPPPVAPPGWAGAPGVPPPPPPPSSEAAAGGVAPPPPPPSHSSPPPPPSS